MELFRITSKNEKETRQLGIIFARAFLRMTSKKALVIGLMGDLGSGKTTFMKGFARGAGITGHIQSPTFVLAKPYTMRKRGNYRTLYHIDAYRLHHAKDMYVLGWEEWAKHPKNIIVVEWADTIKSILPKHRFEIHFQHAGIHKRKLIFYIF
ncbi:MAG: tRNA (adenosine(37)-N6)-threonylcarbamoyltransferase complex ATPase subunit type 1 TsaE [bacterium]|nr:tRNA (adenosine(37)-N6)-threonylcarbamoyltransferase complex ATPase subunit type 1 TsaE [bacterium]